MVFLGDRGKNALSHEKQQHFWAESGGITPLRTAYSAPVFSFPPYILFLLTVFGGPLGVLLAEHFFLLPLLGEQTPLSLAHGYNHGISAHTTVCESFQAGHEPLGSEELRDSHADPILS